MDKKKIKKPIKEGLFNIPSTPDEPVHLMGSKCPECGSVFFPQQAYCGNCSHETEKITLSNKGKIRDCSIVWYPTLHYKGPVPYITAQVELPENVLVPTLITNQKEPVTLPVGTEVEMVLEKIDEDDEGNEIVIYKFKQI